MGESRDIWEVYTQYERERAEREQQRSPLSLISSLGVILLCILFAVALFLVIMWITLPIRAG
jgi:hypothetical protein